MTWQSGKQHHETDRSNAKQCHETDRSNAKQCHETDRSNALILLYRDGWAAQIID
jgi:hypothetical protein